MSKKRIYKEHGQEHFADAKAVFDTLKNDDQRIGWAIGLRFLAQKAQEDAQFTLDAAKDIIEQTTQQLKGQGH
jgi:hypothetical protein